MSHLIKSGPAANHEWKTLRLAAHETPHGVRLPIGPLLAPVAVWKARRAELIRREYEHGWPLGVWLAAAEGTAAIENDLDDFTAVALEFDSLDDGNAYFTARLLRERYGYRGELRMLGDVPDNRLPCLHRIGFDTISDTNGHFVRMLGNPPNLGEAKPRLVAAA